MSLITGNTVTYDDIVYTRTADGKFFYSPEDDGCIIDENGNYFDNQTGEFIINIISGAEEEDDGSGNSGSGNSGSGGFFDDLWNSIKKQITDPQTIKDVFNKYVAGGEIVRPANAPTSGTPPNVKKSNTMLYVIIGVVVVGLGIGIYMATKKK